MESFFYRSSDEFKRIIGRKSNQLFPLQCKFHIRIRFESLSINQILNVEIQETSDPATLSSLYSIPKTNLQEFENSALHI